MSRHMELLLAAGMSAVEAAEKGRLFERAVNALPGGPGTGPLKAYYVPGRVEILGKHTDYAGGRSLLCTVERGFCLVARRRDDAQVHIVNVRSRGRCAIRLDPELRAPLQGWTNYPSVVVRRLARNFPSAGRGADIAFISDLPAASGMSSSSAFIVAIFLALADINCLPELEEYRSQIANSEALAAYLGTIENGESFGILAGDRGVGTFGGSEDHTAILCCRAGELRQYSFCPIRHERTVPLPEGFVLAIGVSGITAIKTGAARGLYNRASLAARKVLELWRATTGRNDATLAAAATCAADAPDRIREILRASRDKSFPADLLCLRFEQFFEETFGIIPDAVEALAACDMSRFGLLVDRSQHGAENSLGNQVPETVALAKSARTLGAVAASSFGAGFGGSVWALVPAAAAMDFASRWSAWYQSRFPAADNACFFITRPGPAALPFQRSCLWQQG